MEMIHGLHKDTLLEINEVIAPISNIKVGDIVRGYNLSTGYDRDNKVISSYKRILENHIVLQLSDGTEIKTSIDSKLLTLMGEWVSPINAYSNKTILHNRVEILSILLVEEPTEISFS
jgi:hypothetical protein